MAQRLHEDPRIKDSQSEQGSEVLFLILYNDEINSFDFIIKSLIEICGHSPEQAEQCATIAHYKGSCDIKKGLRPDLLPLQLEFVRRNIKALIE